MEIKVARLSDGRSEASIDLDWTQFRGLGDSDDEAKEELRVALLEAHSEIIRCIELLDESRGDLPDLPKGEPQ